MKDVYSIRRENLRRIIDEKFDGKQSRFSEAMGFENPSLVSRLLSTNPTTHKNIGSALARTIESVGGRPGNWLDTLHNGEPGKEHLDPPPGFSWPPIVGTAQLGDDGYWLELNFPTGHGDGFVLYPSRDPNAYALRCKGDSMRPRIKPGEFVVAEPNHAYSPGDEVVIRDNKGRVMVKVFNFERGGVIEVSSINEDHKPISIDRSEIKVIHYVAGIFKPDMYYSDIFN